MKPISKLTLLPLCAAVLLAQGPPPGGGPGGRGFGGPRGFGGEPGRGLNARAAVAGAPYSATETVTRLQTLQGGNTISTKELTQVYRDGQGRLRTEETVTPPASSGQAPFTRITILDPVAGYAYVLDSATMTGRQMSIPKSTGTAPPARPARPERPNVTTTDLGTQTINGELSKGTQRTETIPAGTIGNAQAIQNVRVTWISTELNVPVQIKTSDFRIGTSDMELTNIVHAEPNASLFVVPAGYTLQQGRGGRGQGGPRANGRRGPGPQ